MEGRRVQIRTSARQVAKNVSYTGGFFTALAPLIAHSLPLAARVLPTIMSGLATGLLSDNVNKANSGSGGAVGDGLSSAQAWQTLSSTDNERQWSLSSSTSTFC